MKGRHVCGNLCTPYPLQTCASVCGVISMVVAAVAIHKPDIFLQMISR